MAFDRLGPSARVRAGPAAFDLFAEPFGHPQPVPAQRPGTGGQAAAVVLNSGSPSNYSPYGVKQLNCLQLPCSQNTLPTVGGLKATQVQLQFGIGSPSVIQF